MSPARSAQSAYDNELVHVAPGMAAKAADAYDEYLETGNWSVKDVVGQHGIK